MSYENGMPFSIEGPLHEIVLDKDKKPVTTDGKKVVILKSIDQLKVFTENDPVVIRMTIEDAIKKVLVQILPQGINGYKIEGHEEIKEGKVAVSYIAVIYKEKSEN